MAIAQLTFDDTLYTGSLTVTGVVDRSVSPPKFTVTGLIETEARLPDSAKIVTVDMKFGSRLQIFDLLIDSESFGSDDKNIVYQFSARNYRVLEAPVAKRRKGGAVSTLVETPQGE